MVNITVEIDYNQTLFPKITEHCFDWCKNQNIIHQQNLFIGDMFLVFIALFAIVVHIVLTSYFDEIAEHIKIHKDYLESIRVLAIHFSFYVLVIFLIYMLRFK